MPEPFHVCKHTLWLWKKGATPPDSDSFRAAPGQVVDPPESQTARRQELAGCGSARGAGPNGRTQTFQEVKPKGRTPGTARNTVMK